MQSMLMKARAALEKDGRFASGALSEHIADSWHRCLSNGLNPKGSPIDASISFEALHQEKEKHRRLLAVVRPELELLSTQIAGTNHMTAFADSNGVVLDVIMDSEFQASKCAKSVRCGTIWHEEYRGTNALGLALHTGQTSMVTGAEHFFSGDAGVSCVSTPIFNGTGQIIGLLDASSEVAARQFHTQALVGLAASNIENRLFVDEHRSNIIVQFHPREEYLKTQSVAMISFSEEGMIKGANRKAAELLNGLDLAISSKFSDIFRTSFEANLSSMRKGDTVRLVDWLNSSFFARVRLSRPSTDGRLCSVKLNVPITYDVPVAQDEPVFRDEQTSSHLRLAVRAAKLRTPICILGASGAGKTTFVRELHKRVCPENPLIAIDCRGTNLKADNNDLEADVLGEDMERFSITSGGVVVLEDLSKANGRAAERLSQLINRLLQHKNTSGWSIIVTEESAPEDNPHWPSFVKMSFGKLRQMEFTMPRLQDRTDLPQVAVSMLARLSRDHQLSKAAIETMLKQTPPKSFYDLEKSLSTLVVQCQSAVLRSEHVERYLDSGTDPDYVCPQCEGNRTREIKCREINRVFKECNANVALTARKLGVSRNTVYAHTLATKLN